jgi:exodeoxyribonuclease V alpha subunit
MAKRTQEIEATWTFEKHRWDNPDGDTLIGEAVWHNGDKADRIVIKCNEAVRGEVRHPSQHGTYRFYGGWSNYDNPRTGETEKQFHASTLVPAEPHSREGVISYLAKAPGIGKVLAGELFKKFGSNAVRTLRSTPDVAAAAVPRLSDAAADLAAEWLKDRKRIEDCMIDLMELLSGRHMPRKLPDRLIERYGNNASFFVRRNPFILLKETGVGFGRADAMYLELGFPADSLKRQALCAAYAVQSWSNGDTWVYHEVARQALIGKISGTTAKADKAIRLAVRSKKLLAVRHTEGKDGPLAWDGNCCWMADMKKAREEQQLAEYISDAAKEPGWSAMEIDVEAIPDISDHQRAELVKAFSGGSIALLTGYAGTGKSFTLVRLLKLLIPKLTAGSIAIAAPTGRAAVRINELMSEAKLHLPASTIHSLLGVIDSDKGGWRFAHGPGCPLDKKLIILDEVSMADTSIMCDLMSARDKNTLVLFMGDIAQLPPVGHGAPLRDMIAAGLPCGELTEIHRNAGGIVKACSHIRKGERFEYTDNLRLVSRKKPEEQRQVMLDAIDQISAKANLDPIWDFQVICSVNKNSPLDRAELNRVMQLHLNPSQIVRGSKFKLRDKVVNTKNGWLPVSKKFFELPLAVQKMVQINEKSRVYCANGDFGTVIDIQPKFYEIALQAPQRIVIVPRGADEDGDGDTGCNWELGYACTAHKSQGAQFIVAIVMLDSSNAAGRIACRESIYTSFTRAIKYCYVIGDPSVAELYIRRTAITARKTFLRELIQERM